MMKNKLLALFLAAVLSAGILCAGCAAGKSGEATGEVVLRTGRAEYTDQEILEKVRFYCDYYGMPETTLREDASVWNKLVDDTIYEYAFADIAMEVAQEMGIEIPDVQSEEVEEQFNRMTTELDGVIKKRTEAVIEGEELVQAEDDLMAAMGFTRDGYRELALRKVVMQRLQQKWAEDIEISEESLRKEYESDLASQKQYMDLDPAYALNFMKQGQQTVVYYPAGLKYIRTITVPLEAGVRGKAAILYSEGKMREYNILLEEAVKEKQPLIDEIRAKIESGAPFDEIAAQYDTSTVFLKEGQLVSEGDAEMIDDFQKAVKRLEAVGQTEECDTYEGHQFIQYSGEAPEGAVPFEDVKESLQNEAMAREAVLHYEDKMRGEFEKRQEEGSIVMDDDSMKLPEENEDE